MVTMTGQGKGKVFFLIQIKDCWLNFYNFARRNLMSMTSKSVNSAVWKFFNICEEDPTRAKCVICSVTISRGGKNRKSFTTSNLRQHISSKHPSNYSELQSMAGLHEEQRGNDSSQSKIFLILIILHFT